ncbi:MAG: YpdA family putative bacillithiol disulfide reductase [Candidatus Sumerlaeia bacterium]|nr:YpdA family putative bacillithiol disulfide reductase [Candidatus Sumerlaeia bacterium]
MSKRPFDSLIIGGGPAGIAAAHTFKLAGLRTVVLEKGCLAHHISQYPNFMRFFSTNANLEIAGFPLGITEEKPSRAEYLRYLTSFVRYHNLRVRTYSEVTAVEKKGELFRVTVRKPGGAEETLYSTTVIAAVGAWESPRRLNVPGDDLEKVRYRYREPHDYVGRKVLVVGGRNSAIETALELWRAGAEVSLSYRGQQFNGRGVKYWLKPDIENRLKKGEITGFLGSHVRSIGWDSVELELAGGEKVSVENDFVLPMLGYDPPVGFLKQLGIDLEQQTNRPNHNPDTLETNIPGLFVCGVITYGNISGHVFIENSRHHGDLMLPRVREIMAELQATRKVGA